VKGGLVPPREMIWVGIAHPGFSLFENSLDDDYPL